MKVSLELKVLKIFLKRKSHSEKIKFYIEPKNREKLTPRIFYHNWFTLSIADIGRKLIFSTVFTLMTRTNNQS